MYFYLAQQRETHEQIRDSLTLHMLCNERCGFSKTQIRMYLCHCISKWQWRAKGQGLHEKHGFLSLGLIVIREQALENVFQPIWVDHFKVFLCFPLHVHVHGWVESHKKWPHFSNCIQTLSCPGWWLLLAMALWTPYVYVFSAKRDKILLMSLSRSTVVLLKLRMQQV